MNEYEITYLSETHLGEEERTAMDNAIDSKINDIGGSIKHSTPSLRLKLSYPINKRTAAFTRTVHIEMSPDKIDSLNIFLKKHKEIIRFRTIATSYRPVLKAEEAPKSNDKEAPAKDKKPAAKSSQKVTMEAVEKGIEDALEKEVK